MSTAYHRKLEKEIEKLKLEIEMWRKLYDLERKKSEEIKSVISNVWEMHENSGCSDYQEE